MSERFRQLVKDLHQAAACEDLFTLISKLELLLQYAKISPKTELRDITDDEWRAACTVCCKLVGQRPDFATAGFHDATRIFCAVIVAGARPVAPDDFVDLGERYAIVIEDVAGRYLGIQRALPTPAAKPATERKVGNLTVYDGGRTLTK